jgi:hypothetical protein
MMQRNGAYDRGYFLSPAPKNELASGTGAAVLSVFDE